MYLSYPSYPSLYNNYYFFFYFFFFFFFRYTYTNTVPYPVNVVPIDQRTQTISGPSLYIHTHPEQQQQQQQHTHTHSVPTNANMIPIPKETLPSSLPPGSAVYHHLLHQNHQPSFQSHSWVAQVQPMVNNSYSLNQASYDKMPSIIPSQQQSSQHSQNMYTYQNQYLIHSGPIMANSFNNNSFETSYAKGPNHIVLACLLYTSDAADE